MVEFTNEAADLITEEVESVTTDDMVNLEVYLKGEFVGPFAAVSAMVFVAASLIDDKELFLHMMESSVSSALLVLDERLADESEDVPTEVVDGFKEFGCGIEWDNPKTKKPN